MSRNITSADGILILGSTDFALAATQMKGFQADAAFAFEDAEIAQTVRGIDGQLTGGFVFSDLPMTISLLADSPSVDVLETLVTASKVNKTIYRLEGSLTLPSLQKRFIMSRGILTRYTPGPTGQKLLQGYVYSINWESILPEPLV